MKGDRDPRLGNAEGGRINARELVLCWRRPHPQPTLWADDPRQQLAIWQ
ncbi:hypothetical protein M8494_14835 [Serratia ureilytica]